MKLTYDPDAKNKRHWIVDIGFNFSNGMVDRQGMIDWCNDHFGSHSSKYNNPRWRYTYTAIHFKYKKDANWFLLRWI